MANRIAQDSCEILFISNFKADSPTGVWCGCNVTAELNKAPNEKGMQGARELAEELTRRHKISAVYSSHLERAKGSAQPLAEKLGCEVVVLPGLQEKCHGVLEGMSSGQRKTVPELRAYKDLDRVVKLETAEAPNAETVLSFIERVTPVLKAIATRHPGQTVAVFAHDGTLRTQLFRELIEKEAGPALSLREAVQRLKANEDNIVDPPHYKNGKMLILHGTGDTVKISEEYQLRNFQINIYSDERTVAKIEDDIANGTMSTYISDGELHVIREIYPGHTKALIGLDFCSVPSFTQENYRHYAAQLLNFRKCVFEHTPNLDKRISELPAPLQGRVGELFTKQERLYLLKKAYASKTVAYDLQNYFTLFYPSALPAFNAFAEVCQKADYENWFTQNIEPLIDELFDASKFTDDADLKLLDLFEEAYTAEDVFREPNRDNASSSFIPVCQDIVVKLEGNLEEGIDYIQSKAFQDYQTILYSFAFVSQMKQVVETMESDCPAEMPNVREWLEKHFNTLKEGRIKAALLLSLMQ